MSDLSEILEEFLSDLKRIEDLLGLVKGFREFGSGSVPPQIMDGSVIWAEALALKAVAPTLRTDLPLMSGSMVLYLCGRFEYFVRQSVEALSDEIASRATTYDDLPARLRNELRRGTLEVALNHNRYGFTVMEADALVTDLALNIDGTHGGGPIRISSQVLSITESNMNAQTLADLMRRVGMADLWKDIGKQAKLKLHLLKHVDNECTSEAMRLLNELMKDRNQIAHPTGGTTFPDPDQVLRTATFLGALGTVLVELCQVHLASFTPSRS
ncbi:HEPN domain-containing protein [Plantactinospora sp. BB1]|uniref:HEPN domain-containing protein n=1 Tax=Plantactinospora sp. BB1 TaxID=2071627 RepID=UPI00131F24C7|nr:HEPN domain-containing protein [Plantactinospora sp. BB1]